MAASAAPTSVLFALKRAGACGFELAFFQGPRHALESGLAIGVVLVENRDLLDPQRGEVLHNALGLVKIAGTHMEYVAVERLPQPLRPREHAYQRHLGRGEHRHCCQARGRTHRAHQGKHIVLFDQPLGSSDRPVGLITIVPRHQPQTATMDAPLRVDRLKIGLDAHVQAFAKLFGRAAERRKLADDHLLVGHTHLCPGPQAQTHQGQGKTT